MHLAQSYYVVEGFDLLLNAFLVVIFSRLQLRKTWRWMYAVMLARLCYGLTLHVLLLLQGSMSLRTFQRIYFIAFYAGFVTLISLTYVLYADIFRRATTPFPGFAKHARKLIYLALAGIAILMFSSIGSSNAGTDLLARAGISFVRATGTVNICLSAFLVFVVSSFGLSLRSKVFGIIFGFFVCDLGDIAQTIATQLHFQFSSTVFTAIEGTSLVSSLIWIGYSFLPEPLPQPVTVPAESPVYRWSQIANALGARTSVAMPEPQHSFFLADVEQVVDKVFTRHMQESPESNG